MKNLFLAILFAAAALLGGANTHHPAPTSAPAVVSLADCGPGCDPPCGPPCR